MKLLLIMSCLFPFVLHSQEFDREKLETYLDLLEEKSRAMGTISIFEKGEEKFTYSMGYSDIESGEKAHSGTVYRIGSLSKTFTAAMVLKLQEEGRLHLDDPLSDYFAEIPGAGEISLRQLLQHRSGLFNFTNREDYTEWLEEERSREDLLRLFGETEPVFEAGERTEYSNTNYVLLSYIIEDVTGLEFSKALSEMITGPLNLEHTYITDDISSENGHAQSYYRPGEWKPATETHPSIPLGAGAISSSAQELNLFLNALFGGEILNEESLKEMTTPVSGFGLGVFQLPFDDKISWGHTGGIDGFQAVFAYFEKNEVAVSAVFNGLSMSMNDILLTVLSATFGKDFEIPKITESLILTEEEVRQYEGIYKSETFPMDIIITTDGNVLIAQATGQPSFPMEAKGEHVFTFEQAGLKITFSPDENKMVLEQGGMEYVLEREGQ
jgi:D-alanyl-D-alanine carboxypeptidase